MVKTNKEIIYPTIDELKEKEARISAGKYSNVIAFEEATSFRIKTEDRKIIEKIIENDPEEGYMNFGHFMRCAARKLIKEELKRIDL